MMDKVMMIDYRDEIGDIYRKIIDDFEFCVHEQDVYFISSGKKYHIPLDQVVQVYIN